MGTVIPMLGIRQPPATPHHEFAMARRSMIQAYAVWLRSTPGAAAVAAEIEGTIQAMEQLRAMEAAHG